MLVHLELIRWNWSVGASRVNWCRRVAVRMGRERWRVTLVWVWSQNSFKIQKINVLIHDLEMYVVLHKYISHDSQINLTQFTNVTAVDFFWLSWCGLIHKCIARTFSAAYQMWQFQPITCTDYTKYRVGRGQKVWDLRGFCKSALIRLYICESRDIYVWIRKFIWESCDIYLGILKLTPYLGDSGDWKSTCVCNSSMRVFVCVCLYFCVCLMCACICVNVFDVSCVYMCVCDYLPLGLMCSM